MVRWAGGYLGAVVVALLVSTPFTTRGSLGDAAPVNVALVGQIGGQITKVLVWQRYAYVGVGQRLMVVDIADPTQPNLLGESPPLPNRVRDIAVNGSTAYVAYGTGLAVVDVSDPAHPALVGEYQEPPDPRDTQTVREIAMHVQASADVYLLGSDDRLRVVEVSEPSKPTLLSAVSEPNGAMVVSGNNVYLATDGAGVHVIDVSQGLAPAELAHFDDGKRATDLAIANGYAYVAEDPIFPQGQHGPIVGGGLRNFDIADPSNSVEMGFFETHERNGLQLADSTVYLSFNGGVGGARGTRVVDVSDPEHPGQLDTLPLIFNAVAGDRPYGLIADDAGSLAVMDVSDYLHPRATGTVSISPLRGGTRLALSHSYAYVADGAHLSVINVTDPASMQVAADYEAPGEIAAVAVDESVGQVIVTWNTSEPGGGITILDVTDPTTPREVGRTTGLGLGDIAVANSFGYIVQRGNVGVLDLSNAAHPRAASTIVMCTSISSGCESAASLAVKGGRLYVTYFPSPNGGYGLRMFDVRDPQRPVQMADFRTRGIPDRLSLSGGFAYVSIENFSPGLQIVDISDTDRLAEVGSIPDTSLSGVAPAGALIYVLAFDRLQIFDLINPAAPDPVGIFPGLAPMNRLHGDLVTDGATAFALTDRNGLWAFRFTGDSLRSMHDLPTQAWLD
jgi:hypothetical protein